MLTVAVEQHYRRLWGEPSRQAHFSHDKEQVDILKWDEDHTNEGVNLYATVGASDFLRANDTTHRIELFVGFRPALDAVARSLALIALDPALRDCALGDGHLIRHSEPLWLGTEMDTFLMLAPRVEIVPPLPPFGGLHVEFLQLIPVFAAEVEFKTTRGVDALLVGWKSLGVEFWDPMRSAPERLTSTEQ